jgi:hypothetical protein
LSLARLLVSMKDETGRVLVDHFYDDVDPLSDTEKRALAEAPYIDADLMHEFWLGSTEGGGKKLTELITLPSLNIRGMASSRIGGQASNVIPASASVTMDVRLVKGMDPRTTAQRVIEHIRKQGFFVVDQEPSSEIRMAHPKVARVITSGAEAATRTPMDLPISQEVIRAVESARGPAVKLPNMGGGLPLTSVERPLSTRTIVIPIGNHDNNQHSYNENLRLQNLWDGIELMRPCSLCRTAAALLILQRRFHRGSKFLRHGFDGRVEAGQHLAVAIDQILGEVPRNLTARLGIGSLVRQELLQGSFVLASYGDLRKHREGNAKFGFAERPDLSV